MAAVVWVREAGGVRVSPAEGSRVRDLLPAGVRGGPVCDFYVKCNGRRVDTDEELQNGLVYSVEPRLCGGKGGFGSMLRALGAQIEKTTNREACRDLSGRRLRDVNHEKAMAEWIKKQAEREAEKEQRHLERLKRKLAEPKHYFTDPEYHRQCSDMSERLEDSVIKGLQASSSTMASADSDDTRKRRKEPQSNKGKSIKKKCLWMGVEGLEVSSSSGSESDSDSESPCTSSCGSTEPGQHSSESDSDGPAACSSTTATIESQSPAHINAGSSMQETTNMEQPTGQTAQHAEVTPEPEKPAAIPEPPQETTNMEQPTGQTDECAEATPEPERPAAIPEPPQETTITEQPSGQTAECAEATPEPERPAAIPEPPQETPNTDPTPFDLLAFTSAAELETLGLDKLKLELMALGLKCGGTLQERAARLFSVRGLSREKMDPALFAKPSKGKKK